MSRGMKALICLQTISLLPSMGFDKAEHVLDLNNPLRPVVRDKPSTLRSPGTQTKHTSPVVLYELVS